jgi:flagellar motor switch protein FliM
MSEVLSQSEIDALLAAVASGSVDTEEERAPGQDWIAYDITSQEKIFHGKMVGLEGIHDRFARLLRVTLSNYLKKNVSVNVTNTEYLKFGDFANSMILPTSLNILTLPKLHGHMIFVVTSKLLYTLVDAYYGGVERPFSKFGDREEFTAIENTIIQKICGFAVTDLKEAWRLNHPLDIEYARMESNPAFLGAIHSSDLVGVVHFQIELENLSGSLLLVIQLRALDAIASSLRVSVNMETEKASELWREHWMNELMGIPVEAKVNLGATEQDITKIREWTVGSTLPLRQDAAGSLDVLIEGLPKVHGMMGVYRGNAAIQILGINQTAEGKNGTT